MGLFDPAKYNFLADIVRIDTVSNARESVRILKKVFRKSSYNGRLQIKKAMVLAANRCSAFRKRKHLSQKERRELKIIEQIYRNGYKKLKV